MNWCKVIGHSWNYGIEKHEVETWVIAGQLRKHNIDINTRICKRCLTKQKATIGFGGYNAHLNKYCHWSNIKLNTAEDRHKKLKELGID